MVMVVVVASPPAAEKNPHGKICEKVEKTGKRGKSDDKNGYEKRAMQASRKNAAQHERKKKGFGSTCFSFVVAQPPLLILSLF